MTPPHSRKGLPRPTMVLGVSAAVLIASVVTLSTEQLGALAQAGPNIPCAQWQQMHPGWPCVDVPDPPTPPPGPPSTPPPLPTAPPGVQPPGGNGGGPNAGALTPPPVGPGNGTPIVPVPGEERPAPVNPGPASPPVEIPSAPNEPEGVTPPVDRSLVDREATTPDSGVPGAAPISWWDGACIGNIVACLVPVPSFYDKSIDLTPAQSQSLYASYAAFETGGAAAACTAIPVVGELGLGFVCAAIMAGVMKAGTPGPDDYYTIRVQMTPLGPAVTVTLNRVVPGTAVPGSGQITVPPTPTTSGNGQGNSGGTGTNPVPTNSPSATAPRPTTNPPSVPSTEAPPIPIGPPSPPPTSSSPTSPCTGACLA